MPEMMGFSHVDLTVSDYDRAVRWWQVTLGFMLVHQVHEATYQSRAMIHPSGIAVTVMTHDAMAESGPLDEQRVGLDHLAFRVADQDELERWAAAFRHGRSHAYGDHRHRIWSDAGLPCRPSRNSAGVSVR
jgi:glyoxylase I family protein